MFDGLMKLLRMVGGMDSQAAGLTKQPNVDESAIATHDIARTTIITEVMNEHVWELVLSSGRLYLSPRVTEVSGVIRISSNQFGRLERMDTQKRRGRF